MELCSIYVVTNKINGKKYVGQTWNTLKRRWTNHVLNKGVIKLYNAIKKYGKENFSIELLVITHTQPIADYWEIFFIEKLNTINSGYNIREGGSRGKTSTSTKKKMSAWQIGRKLSPEHKANISKARMGMKLSLETRKKLSNQRLGNKSGRGNKGHTPFCKGKLWKFIDGKRVFFEPEYKNGEIIKEPTGYHLSDETKKKMSLALKGKTSWAKGRVMPEETKKKLSLAHLGKTSPNKGKHLSQETKDKISISLKGRGPLSEDCKKKISLALKGKPRSEETKRKISMTKMSKSRGQKQGI
jgi:group I intron endonuclease